MTTAHRPQATIRPVALAAMTAAAGLLAGCVGPTYGTGKSTTEQLAEDVTSVISLTPKQKEPIAYNPRPELVKPGDTSALPPPQENVASVDGAWPESPEERRARIRSEADERNASGAISTGPSAVRPVRDNTKYDDPFYQGKSESPVVAARRAKENRTRRTESTVDLASAPSKRRYLSDPPVEYRKPVETASAGELGEDEAEKERKRIAAAKGKSTKSWKDWLPWN